MGEPRFDTPGRRELIAWNEKLKLSQKALVTALSPPGVRGVDQSTVSRWLAGWSRPDDVFQQVIEDVTGIERAKWLTRLESKRVARIREFASGELAKQRRMVRRRAREDAA